MPSILVTGGNGFVGKALCAELSLKGHSIRVVVRDKGTLNKNAEVVPVQEIDGVTDWSATVSNIDTIIHLAARVHIMDDNATNPLMEFRKVNVEGTLNLAKQAANAGVKRFIFISSIKVNGEHTETGKPFTENDAPNPQDAYGVSKFEAEQGLLIIAQQTGMEVVIIRPPLVYGVGVKANFANLMRIVARGIPLPLGAIYNKRSFVYLENLVNLILHCISHPAAANQIFFVSDGRDLSTTELLRMCALAMGKKLVLIPIPQKLIQVSASLLGKKMIAQRLCGNLQVDISKAKTLLGWIPPVSIEDGLKAIVLGLVQGK